MILADSMLFADRLFEATTRGAPNLCTCSAVATLRLDAAIIGTAASSFVPVER